MLLTCDLIFYKQLPYGVFLECEGTTILLPSHDFFELFFLFVCGVCAVPELWK